MVWSRPLVKKDTHQDVVNIADAMGMKVWKIYDLAIADMKIKVRGPDQKTP